jgi:hypothetical protein
LFVKRGGRNDPSTLRKASFPSSKALFGP